MTRSFGFGRNFNVGSSCIEYIRSGTAQDPSKDIFEASIAAAAIRANMPGRIKRLLQLLKGLDRFDVDLKLDIRGLNSRSSMARVKRSHTRKVCCANCLPSRSTKASGYGWI